MRQYAPKWMWWLLVSLLGVFLFIVDIIMVSSRMNRMPDEFWGYEQATVRVDDAQIRVLIPLADRLRAKGLAGRMSLADDEGMLWIYRQPARPVFWMKGMRFALDFIWIADGRIVELTPNVSPPNENQSSLPRYRPSQAVTHVLEVRAGFTADHRLEVGDRVTIFP